MNDSTQRRKGRRVESCIKNMRSCHQYNCAGTVYEYGCYELALTIKLFSLRPLRLCVFALNIYVK